jgi:hypothetical protein
LFFRELDSCRLRLGNWSLSAAAGWREVSMGVADEEVAYLGSWVEQRQGQRPALELQQEQQPEQLQGQGQQPALEQA